MDCMPHGYYPESNCAVTIYCLDDADETGSHRLSCRFHFETFPLLCRPASATIYEMHVSHFTRPKYDVRKCYSAHGPANENPLKGRLSARGLILAFISPDRFDAFAGACG